MRDMTIAEMRSKGIFEHVSWPGGYPLYYVTKDGGILCPECCNKNLTLLNDPDDPQWYVVDCYANWEDTELTCDHCNNKIESAYGDA